MDYHPSSPSTLPISPGRLRTTSPSRRAAAASTPQQSSAPTHTASTNDTPSKNNQTTRNVLRRPSSSAPGLTSRSERSTSTSPPLSPRPQTASVHHVLGTNTTQNHHDLETGKRTINSYEILENIGSGVHGKVKKARDLETGQIVAIKIVNRVTKKRLGNYDPNEQENKIKREIAIMKKCHHPNIVNLIEVIDNPNSQKVYLGIIPK
jgi:SNF1-activating kinase 1